MRKLYHDTTAATAIEYAFIAVLISIVILVGLQVISQETQKPYQEVGSTLQNSNSGG